MVAKTGNTAPATRLLRRLVSIYMQDFAALQSQLERQEQRFSEKQIWLEAALLRAIEQKHAALSNRPSKESNKRAD